ncbi:hypothetical protein EJB05_44962, partial [Eragrostis curvula]
ATSTSGMAFLSDEILAIFVPIVVYWVYSAMYMALGQSMDKYRLHSRSEEDSKNLVSKRDVVKGVLLQQLVQAAVAAVVFTVTGESSSTAAAIVTDEQSSSSYLTVARQFAVAMVVLDGWQYGWHRYMHLNRFLYRHIHSWHHRLVVPYAFGSQYNHPVEGLLLDTLGGALAFVVSGMSPRASIFFFSLCTVKGVDDHCGLWLPGNVFHLCFWNNTAYHDVHHQLRGNRFNFSQPFFVTWDKVFGTHLPYVIEDRPGGGLEARPLLTAAATSTSGMAFLSDEILAIFVPIVVYWVYSAMYMALGQSMDKYRLHSRSEEDSKNLVSKRDVVKGVLLQQLVQAAVAAVVFTVTGESSSTAAAIVTDEQSSSSYLTVARQFAVAMVVLDGWQYGWHRYMHLNRFLYRHIHSWHHRLVVPYAFGSQYNHPVEGLLLDTLGGALAFVVSGMSPRASIFFFSLCTVKGVDDHCGLWLPGNVFHLCFWNNTAYHDVHHQLRGNRFNFSQPFFVTWDKVFGTHLPYVIEDRPGGGLEARPLLTAGAKAGHDGKICK